MEGKETRFGIAVLRALCGGHDRQLRRRGQLGMHDSLTPLGGFVPMFLMQLGEVAPGGVGTGIYSILMFAILGVFIAGLMIGRTPEYLGKKIEALEMKLASIFILTTPFAVLIGTAVAVMTVAGKAGVAESRRARLQRDPLRLHLGRQQQRQRVRRHFGEYGVLQRGHRARHVHRPFLADHVGSRNSRVAGGEEARAGHRRHHADTWTFVRGAAHRLDPVDRCAYLRPGAGAGAHRRAFHARDREIASLPMSRQQLPLFDRKLVGPALTESFKKLDPRVQWRNPVMFVVYLGTIVTAILYGQALAGHGEAPAGFILAITVWLLFTVLFANFAEALAEGRSRAQASSLRSMRQTVMAKRLSSNRSAAMAPPAIGRRRRSSRRRI